LVKSCGKEGPLRGDRGKKVVLPSRCWFKVRRGDAPHQEGSNTHLQPQGRPGRI